MCLSFPGSSFKPFLQVDSTLAVFQYSGTSGNLHDFSEIMESGLATVSGSSLITLSSRCQGLLICRAQAPIIVQAPILPSWTVGLCSHQPGFVFPRPGAQQCWKVTGEGSIENLCFFQHWAQNSLELFQSPGRAALAQESLALEPFCYSIHHLASGITMSTICPIKWSAWSSIVKQLKHPFLLLLLSLLTIFHEIELFCFTKSKYSNLWRWWRWASTWNENILCGCSDRKPKYLLSSKMN